MDQFENRTLGGIRANQGDGARSDGCRGGAALWAISAADSYAGR